MLASKLSFLFGAVASTATLENVVCNGKDQISMVLTTDQVPSDSTWQVTGCPAGYSSNLDASAVSANGDVYNIVFNPYSACNTTPDPSRASTYSVDITLTAQSGITLGGQTVHFTGTSMELKCTFQDTYSLTSDLGGVNLDGDQLDGEEFALTLSLTRTQADYTTPETGSVTANHMVYHTIAPSAEISGLPDWRIVPNKITLRKGPVGGTEFDIFKHDMGSCGYSEIDWAVTFDQTSQVYNFAFRAMVLEISPDASNYFLTVEVGLCNLASTTSECTGMITQCIVPCVNGSVNGNTCVCDAGWEGAACDSEIPPVQCGNNEQYDPAAGECVRCVMQTICPSAYLDTQPASCFGGPATDCISMCLLGEGLGYLRLYPFEVDGNGLFAPSQYEVGTGTALWYDGPSQLSNVPVEMRNSDAHPVYFLRVGGSWMRPIRLYIDGSNDSGKVWMYRMFRVNNFKYNDPVIARLESEGWTLVPDDAAGQMYMSNNSGAGLFKTYKKLMDVDGLMEWDPYRPPDQKVWWSGGIAFKLDCSETA